MDGLTSHRLHLVGLVAVLLLLASCSTNPQIILRVGVLPARCDATRTPQLVAAHAAAVVVDVAWARWQPAPAVVDQQYVDDVRSRVETCRRAGLAVVLAPGLQYAPPWVRSLPNAVYVDQSGRPFVDGPVNLVFSQDVRDAAERYLRAVVAALPVSALRGVRVGTTASGELGFPGPSDGSSGLRNFWAFDSAAQGGPGRAAGTAPSPAPGWIPGTDLWQGQPFPPSAARRWLEWYARSLVDAVAWQADVLVAAGFRGDIHVPMAGRGISPGEATTAAQSRLGGPGDPNGDVERGLLYREQVAWLAADTAARLRDSGGDLVVDATGLDDASAVRARALDPPQDSCRGDDETRVVDGDGVEAWPSFRWTSALARAHRLRVVGENPGPPSGPETGANASSDGLASQLRHAPSYARECGIETLFVAFEDAFFVPGGGVSLTDLAALGGGNSR